MTKPTVSIIVPNFNKNIKALEALESIKKQTYKNIKIALIDDASTDDSWTFINRWAEHNQIDYLYRNPENMGPSFCRNRGIEALWHQTDAFLFLDSDDILFSEKVEKSVKKWQEDHNHIGVIYSDYEIYHVDKDLKLVQNKEPYNQTRLFQECILDVTSLVSKMALEKSGLFYEDIRCAEDYDLWLRVAQSHIFIHIPEPLHQIRIWKGQTATDYYDKQKWQRDYQIVQQRLLQRLGQA